MFTGIDPMPGGRPSSLNAFARYVFYDTDLSIEIVETIHLRRNDADTGWTGESPRSWPKLQLEVTDAVYPDPNVITLLLRDREFLIATQTYHHFQLPKVTRWDTGTRLRILDPGIHEATIHLMG